MGRLNLQSIHKSKPVVFALIMFVAVIIAGSVLVIFEYFNKKTFITDSPALLQLSFDELYQQTTLSILLVLTLSIIISLLAYNILVKYQKLNEEPILNLATIADQISKGQTFNISDIPVCTEEIRNIYLVFEKMIKLLKEKDLEIALSESRLHQILDNSILSITIKDMDGVLTYCNQHFNKFLKGLNVGKNIKIQDILSKDEAQIQIAKDLEVTETGKPVEYETSIVMKDGKHHLYMVKIPLHDDNDEVYSICTITNDITESKRQAEFLKRSQKMDALGKLTGGIAHDYNNMLAVIIGFSQLIESASSDNQKVVGFAREIKKAGNRGAKLTSRLLAFSRTKAAEAKDVNISKLILSEQHMLEKTLTARIQLDLQLMEGVWSVWLDQDDLQDAILNICINAMHAIKESGIITITTRNINIKTVSADNPEISAGEYVLIEISDNGKGMDNDVQSHIFEPFYSTKGEKGTGLGLSQVYGFVQRSNGFIEVDSTIEVGTSFFIYFPRNYQVGAIGGTKIINDSQDLKGTESILIVDDEQALLSVAEEILTVAGYKINIADSVEKALEIMQQESFDLLFTDIIMPEVNGYELAGHVREKYPDMKILLTSGYDASLPVDEEDSVLKEKMLSKPYGDIKLLRFIRKTLDN